MDAGKLLYDIGQGMDALGSAVGLSRKDKNQIEYVASGIPLIGDVIRARDDFNYADTYLRNTHQPWGSVKYPSHLRGAGSIGSLGYSLSKNILDLYR